MRKAGSDAEVGRVVSQIALPFEEEASDTASPSESDAPQASSAATPAGERSPKKRKWYSLYDKVISLKNLSAAWERVRSNKGAAGCDGQTVEQFSARAPELLETLHEQLKAKSYRPRPVKRVEIPKPGGGKRPLGIPTVRDRIVQQAVLQVLQPIFEAEFSDYSHGFRPYRGCATALDIVDRAVKFGYEWVVDADIEQFFDTVDHEVLLDGVHEEVSDGSVLRLIRMFLESGVLMDSGDLEPTELGTPQGGPLSPLLANIYLHPLDEAMKENGFGLVRYADDFVIFTKSQQRAEEALELATCVLEGLKLHLHPEKTRITVIDEGFDFLGYRHFRDAKGRPQKVVREKSVHRFRDAVRGRTKRHAGQKRPKPKRCTVSRLRKNQRVQEMVARLNRYLRGWHWYFKRVTWSARFRELDGFVRRRLRSAIAGRFAKGRWHSILSNDKLREIGLVSLCDLQASHQQGSLSSPPGSG
jgi:RNA-directed DNA polymerase